MFYVGVCHMRRVSVSTVHVGVGLGKMEEKDKHVLVGLEGRREARS